MFGGFLGGPFGGPRLLLLGNPGGLFGGDAGLLLLGFPGGLFGGGAGLLLLGGLRLFFGGPGGLLRGLLGGLGRLHLVENLGDRPHLGEQGRARFAVKRERRELLVLADRGVGALVHHAVDLAGIEVQPVEQALQLDRLLGAELGRSGSTGQAGEQRRAQPEPPDRITPSLSHGPILGHGARRGHLHGLWF